MLPGCPCISLVLVLPLCRPCCLCRSCVGPCVALDSNCSAHLHIPKMLGRYGAAMQHEKIKTPLTLQCWPLGGHTHQILPLLPLHFLCACVAFVSPLLFVLRRTNKSAPAGSRTRGTSMGGLYVTATLLAVLHHLTIY